MLLLGYAAAPLLPHVSKRSPEVKPAVPAPIFFAGEEGGE